MNNKPDRGVVFLEGKTVYLRPFEREDLPLMQAWMNDPEIRGITGEVAPSNRLQTEAYFERVKNDESRAWFMIVRKDTGQVIGETGLLRMFHAWRTTDMSIIIGEKDCWGKGYGTEAMLLMLDYAFGYLSFHRVAIGVVGFNERALRFYEKIGFKQEGVQRDGYYYNPRFHDFVMMSILEDEYRERYQP